MKKVFGLVAVIAVVVLVMPSCSNKEQCWQAKLVIENDTNEGRTTIYTWGTEDEINTVLKEWKDRQRKTYTDEKGYSVQFTMEKVKASELECEDKSGFKSSDRVPKYEIPSSDWINGNGGSANGGSGDYGNGGYGDYGSGSGGDNGDYEW